jgi:hypothetical protein
VLACGRQALIDTKRRSGAPAGLLLRPEGGPGQLEPRRRTRSMGWARSTAGGVCHGDVALMLRPDGGPRQGAQAKPTRAASWPVASAGLPFARGQFRRTRAVSRARRSS